MIQYLPENAELTRLNEMAVNVTPGQAPEIANSVFYAKIKHLLFGEIVSFTREKYELRADLQRLREFVGDLMTEAELRQYLDGLKDKYNNKTDTNIGVDYHIESTRIDYGVAVFAVIKRDEITAKTLVYRFRKAADVSLNGLSNTGVPQSDYGASEDAADDRSSYENSLIDAIIQRNAAKKGNQ